MIVKLKNQSNKYQDLSPKLSYFVIGIEANDYRILNNYGKPYLYPSKIFDILDNTIPEDWITEYGEEGEVYSYPKKLNSIGFFEDFFDGKNKAVAEFWHVVNQRLSNAA